MDQSGTTEAFHLGQNGILTTFGGMPPLIGFGGLHIGATLEDNAKVPEFADLPIQVVLKKTNHRIAIATAAKKAYWVRSFGIAGRFVIKSLVEYQDRAMTTMKLFMVQQEETSGA